MSGRETGQETRPETGREKENHEAKATRAAQARLAACAAAYATGVRVEEILSPTRRGPLAAFARQLAMYLTHVGFGLSLSNTAVAFDRDRSTIGHAVRLIEARREDPRFDALASALESMMLTAPKPAWTAIDAAAHMREAV